MEEVDYRRVREIMWSDKRYGLRELPDFYGYPLLIKLMKKSVDTDKHRSFSKGDVLRIHGEEEQRRLIALDGRGSHWSFPLHVGGKFEVADKKGNKTTMYMSEMAESGKLPKKFSFAQREEMQVKISGEDRASAAHIIAGDYKPKEIIRIRIFKANKIENDEIDPRVIFLPAYLDMEFTIASKLACDSDAVWEEYMDAITLDIRAKVNLDMHRGKSDIQIYYFLDPKTKKSRRASSIYEEQPPTVSVTIGTRSIMKKRKSSSRSRLSEDGRSLSTSSMCSFGLVSTFTPEDNEANYGPKKSVFEVLSEQREKEESEMTEEEIRQQKHRKMMLAFLAREEEEERENTAKGGGAESRGDETDGAVGREDGDGDDVDESDSSSVSTSMSQGSEQSSQGSESQSRPTSIEGVPSRLRLPGDGSPFPDESVATDDASSTATPPRIPPRIPTRRTAALMPHPSANGVTSGASGGGDSNPNQGKVPPEPPPKPKPKPDVPGPKPLRPKPLGPKPVGPKPPGPKPPGPKPPARPTPVTPPRGDPQLVSGAHVATTSPSTAAPRFTNIRDFPPDLAGITINDMCTAMRLLKLSKYEECIREHSIDGEMAKELTEDIIKGDLRMNLLDSKKFFKFIHENWRPT